MIKILLVYTSMTGNTEEMAEKIEEILSKDNEVELKKIDIMSDYPEDLDHYNGIIIGSYTWGDGDIPDEMMDFYDELQEYDLSHKIAAVFGSGDTCYEHFCGAVDLFKEQLLACNGTIPFDSLKVDMEPEKEDLEHCTHFAKSFLIACHNTEEKHMK
jgi:flavodoxin I